MYRILFFGWISVAKFRPRLSVQRHFVQNLSALSFPPMFRQVEHFLTLYVCENYSFKTHLFVLTLNLLKVIFNHLSRETVVIRQKLISSIYIRMLASENKIFPNLSLKNWARCYFLLLQGFVLKVSTLLKEFLAIPRKLTCIAHDSIRRKDSRSPP